MESPITVVFDPSVEMFRLFIFPSLADARHLRDVQWDADNDFKKNNNTVVCFSAVKKIRGITEKG